MVQGSLNLNMTFLAQVKNCDWQLETKNLLVLGKNLQLCSPVTHRQTHSRTHTKVTTVGTLSGFPEFFLQPIIKGRPNNIMRASLEKFFFSIHLSKLCDIFSMASPFSHFLNPFFPIPVILYSRVGRPLHFKKHAPQ